MQTVPALHNETYKNGCRVFKGLEHRRDAHLLSKDTENVGSVTHGQYNITPIVRPTFPANSTDTNFGQYLVPLPPRVGS